jgi:hypothetical protein
VVVTRRGSVEVGVFDDPDAVLETKLLDIDVLLDVCGGSEVDVELLVSRFIGEAA